MDGVVGTSIDRCVNRRRRSCTTPGPGFNIEYSASSFALLQRHDRPPLSTPQLVNRLQAKWDLQQQAANLAELKKGATESERREKALTDAEHALQVRWYTGLRIA